MRTSLCRHKVPNVEFVLNLHDQPSVPRSRPRLPVLSWSASSSHWDIPIPYQWSLVDIPPTSQGVKVAFDPGEWGQREDVAVWRGSNTGMQPRALEVVLLELLVRRLVVPARCLILLHRTAVSLLDNGEASGCLAINALCDASCDRLAKRMHKPIFASVSQVHTLLPRGCSEAVQPK